MVLDAIIWSNPLDNAIAIAFSNFFDSLSRVFKNIFISISAFGDNGIFYILVGILLLFFIKSRKLGFTLLIASLSTLIFNDLIFKNIFDRARPFQDPELLTQLTAVMNNNGLVYGIVPSSSSFPSGHTFTAFFVLGGVISLYIFDKENRKTYLPQLIFFSIFAFLMGCSRILLSHHYFTDVLCGAILGTLFGLTSYLIIKYLYKLGDLINNKWIKKVKSN